MVTLPLEFDTTATWQRIVRNVQLGGAALAALILIALITGNAPGAIGLAAVSLVAYWLVRRTRGFPMGAVGTLTAAEVTVRPVKVLWYSLPVPAGRFPIDRFQSVAVVDYGQMARRAGGLLSSVELTGRPGTPDIRVAYLPEQSAAQFAEDLTSIVKLPYERRNAPGVRSSRVTV